MRCLCIARMSRGCFSSLAARTRVPPPPPPPSRREEVQKAHIARSGEEEEEGGHNQIELRGLLSLSLTTILGYAMYTHHHSSLTIHSVGGGGQSCIFSHCTLLLPSVWPTGESILREEEEENHAAPLLPLRFLTQVPSLSLSLSLSEERDPEIAQGRRRRSSNKSTSCSP